MLAQVLILIALDHCRFGDFTSTPATDEAKKRLLVSQLAFLKGIVRQSSHQELESLIDKGGIMSCVRFRPTSSTMKEISQEELAYLWRSGEGLVGAPNQPGWDLLLPVKVGQGYSFIVVQVKNQLSGPQWSPKYTSASAFPTTKETTTQKILLYLELNGARCESATSCVLPLSDLQRETRQDSTTSRHFCVGNWGLAGKDGETAAMAFPVLAEVPGCAAAFASIINAPFVEAAATPEEEDILNRARPVRILPR